MKKKSEKVKTRSAVKKIAFIIGCVLVVGSMFFAFVPTKKRADEEAEKTVITLWHVDLFEGGKGSRKGVLSALAKRYEKDKKSVYISVIEQSREGMEQKIASGIVPDLISFSAGVDGVENYAKKIPTKDRFAGYSSDGFYAAAWVYGGYFLLTHGGEYDNLYLSDCGFNAPFAAAYFGKIKAKKYYSFSPEKAFSSFLSNEKGALLGTQRDLCRAEKAGVKITVKPVCGFDDLVQYISVTSGNRYEESLDFLRFVLKSDDEIRKLRLLSASGNNEKSDDAVIAELCKIKAEYGVWAFEKREVIKKIDEYAKCLLEGRSEEIKNLKNSLKSLKIN